MCKILNEAISSLILLFVLAPLLGAAFLAALFGLLKSLGIFVHKQNKIQAWLYATLLIFLFSLTVKIFSL